VPAFGEKSLQAITTEDVQRLKVAERSRPVRHEDPDGQSLTQKRVQGLRRRVALRAHVKPGVHILRHTFCSHPAMRGAPANGAQLAWMLVEGGELRE